MVKAVYSGTTPKAGLKFVLKKFHQYTKNPETYLIAQPSRAEKIKHLVKCLYDHGQVLCPRESSQESFLNELVVDEMDDEQIWQQLELKNEQLLEGDLHKTSKLLSMSSKRMQLPLRAQEEASFPDDDEDVQQEPATRENDTSLEKDVSPRRKKSTDKKKFKRSIVDDKFFKLEDMARFLDEEDDREMRRQAGKPERNPLVEIDYFSEHFGEDDDTDSVDMKYSDFFDDDNDDEDSSDNGGSDHASSQGEDSLEEDELVEDKSEEGDDNQGSRANEENSEDEVERNRRLRYELYKNSEDFVPKYENKKPPIVQPESTDEESDKEAKSTEGKAPKSSFELRQEKLQQRIQKMEDQLLQDKPWQLKGEISADTRPQNSLLEEVLEFESTTRPAPVITEETTMRLEDIIKQRIKNKVYDDVERKIRPTDNPREYRKQLVLDSEKSKQSLAQIYEKDYLQQLEKANPAADQAEEEEPKEHKEIRSMMKTLLAQLDALSNFHYTPRPAVPELKIITNTPAISMEEVAPVATSDATLLAPEEVHNRPKGDVMSKDERTKGDKNRERRLKKRFQREKFNRQAEKERRLLEKGVAPKTKDLQEKLLKKVTKAKNVTAMAETKGMAKSSTAFFSQLQNEVSAQIKSKLDPSKKKNKKHGSQGLRATHVKL